MTINKEDVTKHWADSMSHESINSGSTVMTKTIRLEHLDVQSIFKNDEYEYSVKNKEREVAIEVIEDGTKYSFCGKVSYICPHCNQIMLRPVCITKNKPKYCYKCGGRIKFRGGDKC